MKPVYIVQVTFSGLAAEMNAEAQEKFGANDYRTNGLHDMRRSKRAAETLLRDWSHMGEVAMREFRQAESLEEAMFALIQ